MGYLVPFQHVDEFANAITYLLDTPAVWEQFSAEAKLNGQRFNWNTIAEDVVKLYQRSPDRPKGSELGRGEKLRAKLAARKAS